MGPARRRRLASFAVLVAGLLLGGLIFPGAAAEDLKDRKRDVEKKIDVADQHLHESSRELEAATQALLQAQADLQQAQAHLAETQGQLAAAQALDREMQARLEEAVRRLEQARAELTDGQAEVAAQESALRQMVASSYEQGDPDLMGLSMVFTTQDPAQLAGSLNSDDDVVNLQSRILDQLEAAKVLLTVKEAETEAAKRDVAERRQEAAENLRLMEALELQAREAEQQV